MMTSPAAMRFASSCGCAPIRTSASPVAIPILTFRPSSSRAQLRIASAALTARSGSSSCARGAPKSAMTASSMNLSTVPPKRSGSARIRAWKGASSAQGTSSGSSVSACAVKAAGPRAERSPPFATRRRPGRVPVTGSRLGAEAAPSGFSRPQLEHVGTLEAYDASGGHVSGSQRVRTSPSVQERGMIAARGVDGIATDDDDPPLRGRRKAAGPRFCCCTAGQACFEYLRALAEELAVENDVVWYQQRGLPHRRGRAVLGGGGRR